MKTFLRNGLMSFLIMILVMGSFSTAYAGELTKINAPTNNSFEIEINRQDLQKNGSTEVIVIKESDGTLKVIDNNDVAANSTAVYCTVKVAAWLSSSILVNVSAEASAPIKKVTGKVKVTKASWLNPTQLDLINVSLYNPAGSTFLGDQYTAWVGSEDEIKLKFYDVYATDLYGRVGSLISWSSGTIKRP
ncbi:hypothetical protein [Vallitalea maricola]|uniref:Uncharacterized protein n=1 Tax=Vallitalea maricola TaxID=3074433 RepID=A0ACB5UFY0_9FIRM|nr:hypothetical protein AN2V17_10710 [Vallitalea sp. AN17-2]